ncbi:MAG TPA: hypothetical protein VII06_29475 [Chloroflexota bacterium]
MLSATEASGVAACVAVEAPLGALLGPLVGAAPVGVELPRQAAPSAPAAAAGDAGNQAIVAQMVDHRCVPPPWRLALRAF